ncbi:MAG: hypothetical protein IPG50_36015 [Myxococcales bacterium]|nr:hypothetical protein [Myxococcales bacterium]
MLEQQLVGRRRRRRQLHRRLQAGQQPERRREGSGCKDVAAYGAKQIPEADAKKAACFGSAVTTLFVGGAPKDDAAPLEVQNGVPGLPEQTSREGRRRHSGEPDCSSAVKDLGSCNATIGELNTCFADQVNGAEGCVHEV